jgi:hypothetical protein
MQKPSKDLHFLSKFVDFFCTQSKTFFIRVRTGATMMRCSAALALLLSGASAIAQAADPAPVYQPPLSGVPMNAIVHQQAIPELDYFFEKLSTEKDDVVIDGVHAMHSDDKFLPGKIAIGLAHLILNTPRDHPKFQHYLSEYRAIVDRTASMDNHTWGIYYNMLALYRLKNAGLLDQAVSPATLAILRKKLDWRTFVAGDDYHLIDLPTNYYGVAFSIARLRMLLGWEDEAGSKVLLDKMLTHYKTYSGVYGFSDETAGEGRFDRYSILLIAEICQRFIETGLPVTPELKALLRKSAVVALNLANPSGDGISFGRSIGAYGDTAMLEILSVSAYLDVLTPDEKQYAYAYATRIVAKYADFWYDPATHSVNLWDHGRRTDDYRAKHRILGENFSLLHQLLYTNDLWNHKGFENQSPKPDLQAWLKKNEPPFSLTWFARGEYDRALAIFRDQRHVFSLLMVNGGASQHANAPYYPLPFSTMLLAGRPDSGYAHPQLLPKFTLADGSELLGTAFIKDITTGQQDGRYTVRYRQDELDRLGKKSPVKDGRIQLKTEYTMAPGQITRSDIYTPASPQQVAGLTLEFASFSDDATVDGLTVRFSSGDVRSFTVGGMDRCRADKVVDDEAYKTPSGAMHTHILCSKDSFTMDRPLAIKWTVNYQ